MPIVVRALFPETLYFSITIDGVAFPYATEGSIKHTVNGARAFSCGFAGKEALLHCRLGAVVEVSWGRGNLSNLIDDRKFTGIIKDLKPRTGGSFFTAVDYVTFLAESQYVQYKAEDYIGEDLYYAAARACDYKGIDTSRLIGGSGILITKDMDLFGWKTRKEFVDACFDEMKIVVNDERHPNNTIRQWNYAIRSGKRMDFFLPDADNTIPQSHITISEESGNLLEEEVVSQIDTTRLINAITVVSSKDEDIYVKLEDSNSQKTYGIIGKFLSHPSTDKNELEKIGYKVLNRFKEPTVSYSVSLANSDNLDIGDLVTIDVPSLPKAVTKTIVAYEVSLGDTLVTRYDVGQPKVSLKEFVDLVKEPTNR